MVFQPSLQLLVLMGAAILFMVVYPLGVALIVRHHLAVGWRYFGYGALVFFVSQIVLRVPIVLVATPLVAPAIAASRPLAIGWGLLLAVTAGVFECGGRYFGYRWLMRREDKTWGKAIMYGVGHGGLESMVLVAGLAILQVVSLLTLTSASVDAMPAAQHAAVMQQITTLTSGPFWLPLLGAWERLWTLAIQVALSVLVLQVFRRGSMAWLALAIGLHSLVDFVTPTLIPLLGLPSLQTSLLSELTIAVFGLFSLWIVFALRPRASSVRAESVHLDQGHVPVAGYLHAPAELPLGPRP